MSAWNTIAAFGKRHAPEILTGIACAGVGLTAFLACKETIEAHEIMERNDIYSTPFAEKDKDDKREQITHFTKYVLPIYTPAIIAGIGTVGCILGAQRIGLNRIHAMASICAASTTALETYKQTVEDTIGEKKAAEIAQTVVQKQLDANPKSEQNAIVAAKPDTESLWCDLNTGRYFYADMEFMRRAEADLKNALLDNDIVTQNDIYDRLNLDEVKLGDQVGFDIKRGDQVIFEYNTAMTDDGQPMCTVFFPVKPIY